MPSKNFFGLNTKKPAIEEGFNVTPAVKRRVNRIVKACEQVEWAIAGYMPTLKIDISKLVLAEIRKLQQERWAKCREDAALEFRRQLVLKTRNAGYLG